MLFKEMLETDKKRHEFACIGKLDELYKTYDGSYADLPNMNAGKMWDFFMNLSEVHHDRVADHRIRTTARFVDTNKRIIDFGVGYGWIIPVLMKKNNCSQVTLIRSRTDRVRDHQNCQKNRYCNPP